MQDTNLEEQELIGRAIQGDGQAFGELYKLHLDAIYRYIFYRIGFVEDAEDLTEQTFLKAWEALPRYKQLGKPFTSWLYRIAHNVIVDHHRLNNKMKVLSEDFLHNKIDDRQTTAFQKVVEREEISILTNAIMELSDEQQQVVILRFIEGMSHKQVAQIIGKNEGTCRMIQYRALSALHQILRNDTE